MTGHGSRRKDERLLKPEEKRAPKVVPWRPDTRERLAGIGLICIAILATGWCANALFLQSRKIGWREDGIVVEVTRIGNFQAPRAEVTTVSRGEESYPWAFAPFNTVPGACNNPLFRIDGMPERGRIYNEGEELAIRVVYSAPGCREMHVAFNGRFAKGSPWFEEKCLEIDPKFRETACDDYFNGSIFSEVVAVDASQGALTFTARPGTTPPVDASSPPGVASAGPGSVAGFKLCGITISVSDGNMNGSRSFQQIHVDCHSARDYP